MTQHLASLHRLKSMLILLCFILVLSTCKPVEDTLPTATIIPDTLTVAPTPTEQTEQRQIEWVELAAMPEPVTEITGALLDGKFYVAGGISDPPVTTRFTQVYDIATNTWETVADLPIARDHAAMTSFEGKVYLFGGFDLHGGEEMDMVWAYDPA